MTDSGSELGHKTAEIRADAVALRDDIMCARCRQNVGTERWVGEGGALALVHGMYEMWCELCVLEVQLAHALKVVESVPSLRARVAALRERGAEPAEQASTASSGSVGAEA